MVADIQLIGIFESLMIASVFIAKSMKGYFGYISVLMLLVSGCVCRYNIKKHLPKDTTGLGIFIVDNHYKGKSYIAITNSQIDFLTTRVELKKHNGINNMTPMQTVFIVKNHVLYKRVSQRISTNASGFPDSLSVLEGKIGSFEKLSLIKFMDSLDKKHIPFFLNEDTLSFYSQVCLEIEYKKGNRPYGAGRSIRQQHKLVEEIINLVRELFNSQLIFQHGASSGDGKASLAISVPINSEAEIPPDLELRLKEQFSSITKVSIGKMEPIRYQINYFVESP